MEIKPNEATTTEAEVVQQDPETGKVTETTVKETEAVPDKESDDG